MQAAPPVSIATVSPVAIATVPLIGLATVSPVTAGKPVYSPTVVSPIPTPSVVAPTQVVNMSKVFYCVIENDLLWMDTIRYKDRTKIS